MLRTMIFIIVFFLNMCAIAQDIQKQQDECLYLNPIFVEVLSEILKNDNVPIVDDYFKPFHLLRFFKLDSNLYFTIVLYRTFPLLVKVQENDYPIEIDTNCIYYYLINGHNVLINDYCYSTGYGLYFPCQTTNNQALVEKSISPPHISMSRDGETLYYRTYQVLQDSIIKVPLILPMKYEGDREAKLILVKDRAKRTIRAKKR